MLIIWILFFFQLNFFNCEKIEYELIKGDEARIVNSSHGYTDLSDYYGYDKMCVKLTIIEGTLIDGYLTVGGTYKPPNIANSFGYVGSFIYDSTEINKKLNYSFHNTYIFKIPRHTNFNYYYFEFPPHNGNSVLVEISSSGLPSVLSIILGIIGLAILFLCIFGCCCLKSGGSNNAYYAVGDEYGNYGRRSCCC